MESQSLCAHCSSRVCLPLWNCTHSCPQIIIRLVYKYGLEKNSDEDRLRIPVLGLPQAEDVYNPGDCFTDPFLACSSENWSLLQPCQTNAYSSKSILALNIFQFTPLCINQDGGHRSHIFSRFNLQHWQHKSLCHGRPLDVLSPRITQPQRFSPHEVKTATAFILIWLLPFK